MMRFVPRRANTNMRSTLSSNQRRRCSLYFFAQQSRGEDRAGFRFDGVVMTCSTDP